MRHFFIRIIDVTSPVWGRVIMWAGIILALMLWGYLRGGQP